jgi:hypothetical protein
MDGSIRHDDGAAAAGVHARGERQWHPIFLN